VRLIAPLAVLSGKQQKQPIPNAGLHDEEDEMTTTSKRPRDDPAVRTSKTMARLLRHSDMPMRPDGFCRMDDLVRHPSMKGASIEDIQRIVDNDTKGRYSIMTSAEDGVMYIRANQGHSVKTVVTEELLTPITSALDYRWFPSIPEIMHPRPEFPLYLHSQSTCCALTMIAQTNKQTNKQQLVFTGPRGLLGITTFEQKVYVECVETRYISLVMLTPNLVFDGRAKSTYT